MTHALNRFSAALTGWIPDISGIPLRRQIIVAGVVSLLINLLAIILVALIFDQPPKPLPFAKPKLRMRGIELVVVPPEPEPEPIMPFTLQQKPMMPFMDSSGLNIAREAALNPIFEADENMRAGSELPATGDAPLPSQMGADRPFNAFKTQRSLLGNSAPTPFPPAEETPPLAAIPPVAPAPPAPPVEVPEPATPPAPPEPPPAVEKIAEKTEPAKPAPEPLIEPKPTQTRPDDIVMNSKVPTAVTKMERPPATPMPAKPTPALRPMDEPQQMAKLTTPAPKPQMPRESGAQLEETQTRIEGSITNRDKKSVDAVATPMGKYMKRVKTSVGSRWQYYVQNPPQPGLYAFGSAEVRFYITQEGKVEEVKVLSNSANRSFAEMCVAAISDAQRNDADSFRPPEGSLEAMRDGRLEYTITFTYYTF